MTRQIDDYTGQIHTGNCFDILDEMPENAVHAVVADGPYGLAFMGQSWDDFEPLEYQRWSMRWAKKAKRVLKPGGHLLSFSGTRTYHRMASGVEDAGYEIRDCLMWAYGTGFPKALDVGKKIDEQGAQVRGNYDELIQTHRERKGLSRKELAAKFAEDGQEPTGCVWNWENRASAPTVENFNKLIDILDLPTEKIDPEERDVIDTSDKPEGWFTSGDGYNITAPATPEAEQWDGFKTALKPAFEPVVVARKPLSESTVAENVLQHGTGALNIDGTRIPTDESWSREDTPDIRGDDYNDHEGNNESYGRRSSHNAGRYPANLVLDEQAGAMLDSQSGECPTGDLKPEHWPSTNSNVYGEYGGDGGKEYQGNTGGASRYFYCAKASKAERTLDGAIDNKHPTVKPADLMDWLVTLVTAENQIVLDPFAGSGTTCKAAKEAGREFVGIEKNAEYADIARARCGLKPADPEVLTGDEQSALSSFVKAERAETDGGQRQ